MTATDRWRAEPNELPRLALCLATLALAGFSVVLTAQMSWLDHDERGQFALRNVLGEHGRLILLLSLGAGLLLPALIGLWALRRKPLGAALRRLELVAALAAPLCLLFVIPGLFLSQVAETKPLFYLVVLGSFGLSLNALLATAFARSVHLPPGAVPRGLSALALRVRRLTLPRGIPVALLLICAAVYSFVLDRYALAHHRLIQTTTTDLGIADNVLSNLLHGLRFRAPAYFGLAGGNYLTRHAEYGSVLFLPFYALHPGAAGLLQLQARVAGLAVLPLYLFTARKLGRAVAFIVGAAYLLCAPQHGALIAGFSWLPAVTLFAFTLYYAIESERRAFAWIALACLLSISEWGPINALGLGAMLLASRKNARWGLLLLLTAAPLAAFNLWLSTRAAGARVDNPLALASITFWQNPVFACWDLARNTKVTSILHALSPLCLLPVLELSAWPLLIPGILFTAAASTFWPNSAEGQLASVVWVPGTFIALSSVLERRLPRAGAPRTAVFAAVVALCVTALSHSYDFGALLRRDGFGGLSPSVVRSNPEGDKRFTALHQLLGRIPPAASVAATTYLLPHVSARPDVFDTARPFPAADYFLLSSRETSYVKSALSAAFATHKYQLVAHEYGEFYLFSHGVETKETKDALAHLGLVSP